MAEFIERVQQQGQDVIILQGDWVLSQIQLIARAMQSIPQTPTPIEAHITKMDTAGAALFHDLMQKVGIADRVKGLSSEQQDLIKLLSEADIQEAAAPTERSDLTNMIAAIGEKTALLVNDFLDLARFLGQTVIVLIGSVLHPTRLRLTSIIRHIRETGLNAVPIVALIAFLISIVLAYQGATQLRRFGAEIFTINMVAVSVLREMGVLLTAIMIAGRSGSAFTAEIGVMQVNEEVDAMKIMGVDAFEVLVLPRLLALMITLPLLTFLADLMGLLGGGLVSYSSLNISYDQYLDRFRDAVSLKDFWVGLVKAPVFAFFIAIVGCMRGLQVKGSAESVGRLTTVSVVQSIFFVLLLDALFSILFTKLGI